MRNIQSAEKPAHLPLLDIHSIFYTIQGEGPFCGTPAIFIRLAGCNLQCPLCDTDYTSTRSLLSVDKIIQKCQTLSNGGLVVLTGGEPFRQDTGSLLTSLVKNSYYVQIETNGTLAPPDILYSKDISARSGVYIVCSPKTPSIHKKIEDNACCFKYVLSYNAVNEVDKLPTYVLGLPIKVYRLPQSIQSTIYVQPADHNNKEENAKNIKAAINSCMQKKYILQLQIHKILEVL